EVSTPIARLSRTDQSERGDLYHRHARHAANEKMLDDLRQPTDELERHLEIRAARVANQMVINIVARFWPFGSGKLKRTALRSILQRLRYPLIVSEEIRRACKMLDDLCPLANTLRPACTRSFPKQCDCAHSAAIVLGRLSIRVVPHNPTAWRWLHDGDCV